MKGWSGGRGRLLVILLAALALQGWLFRLERVPTLRPLFGDELQYHAQALEVAAGRLPAPDFIWPPLGGWFLGAVYALGGPSRVAVEAVQLVLFLGAGLLLRSLAVKALQDPLGADLAMTLFLLDPQVAAFTHGLWPEILHLVLMLGALALLFAGPRPRAATLAGAGALTGLALLTKNLLGPFLPVLALAAALRPPREAWAARATRVALFLAGVALVAAPVVVRNGVRYGTWAIADAGPLNLWTGLTDPGGREYDRNHAEMVRLYAESGSTPRERNAYAWEQIRKEVARRGAPGILAGQLRKQYPRLLDKSSFFTDQLPGGRIATAEARLDGPPLSPIVLFAYGIWGLVLVLSAFGICLLDGSGLRGAYALPALFLAYNLFLFLFLLAKTRFRIPFLPALDLFAAWAVVAWARVPRPARLPLRLAAGALLAAAALYAAFA